MMVEEGGPAKNPKKMSRSNRLGQDRFYRRCLSELAED